MPTELQRLSEEDREILLRAPAIVAILAAISDDGEVSAHEKTESIKLAHLRTYSSEPILHNYYKRVDEKFVETFDSVMSKLPEDWKGKEAFLKGRIEAINKILPKLNDVYAQALIQSLKSFSKHVFKSNSSFLEFFILPMFMNKVESEGFDPKIGK